MQFQSCVAMIFVSVLLAACGGGNSGAPGNNNQTNVSASTSLVSASGTTTDLVAPTAIFTVTAGQVPSAGLYVDGRFSSNGISSASLSQLNGTQEEVILTFKAPAALGVGVYNDVVSIKVCYDKACQNQVTNSPLSVNVQYTVTAGNPATATPTLTALSPNSAPEGGSAFTITATGVNYAGDSILYFGTAPLTTTYVSSTQLTAQVPAALLNSVASYTVTVSNQSGGGGTSNGLPFAITVVPLVIQSLSPSTVSTGGSAFLLGVAGSGFPQGATVQWNGVTKPTTFVSASQLYAQIAVADIASAGSVAVTVVSPGTGNVASNAMTVMVGAQSLQLGALWPTAVVVGGPAFQLTVTGNGFTPTSTVRWNGSSRATTYISASELVAQIGVADIAATGTASVTVVDGSTTSTAAGVAIGAASVDAIGWRNNALQSGAISFASILPVSSWPSTSAGTWSVTFAGTPTYAMAAAGNVFVLVNTASQGTQLYALSQATGQAAWGPLSFPGGALAVYDAGSIFVQTPGNLATGAPGHLQAINASTGGVFWTTALFGNALNFAAPVASNGLVFVTAPPAGGPMYAIYESNGALAWTQNLAGNYMPALTADGLILNDMCVTYALRPLTGEPLWTNNPACAGSGNTGFAVVANGVAYTSFGPFGNGPSATNAETGSVLVNGSLPAQLPALGSTLGYFLANPGFGTSPLSAVTLPGGSPVVWIFTGDGNLTTAPLLVNQYVFVGSGRGNLYALDAATGAVAWQVALPAALNGIPYPSTYYQGLTAGDGLLLVPAGNSLTAFLLSTSP